MQYVEQLAAARPGALFYRDNDHFLHRLRRRLEKSTGALRLATSASAQTVFTCSSDDKLANSQFDEYGHEIVKI